jgi:hypothetical protein
MALNRSRDSHAAQNTVSGLVSNGATWYETIILTDENGDQLVDVDADTWQFQFRCDAGSDSADLTLSTTDGTLTVTEGASSTTLLINVPQATISDLEGEYVADLVSKAASGSRLTHRAHGIVTFRSDPIAF